MTKYSNVEKLVRDLNDLQSKYDNMVKQYEKEHATDALRLERLVKKMYALEEKLDRNKLHMENTRLKSENTKLKMRLDAYENMMQKLIAEEEK